MRGGQSESEMTLRDAIFGFARYNGGQSQPKLAAVVMAPCGSPVPTYGRQTLHRGWYLTSASGKIHTVHMQYVR